MEVLHGLQNKLNQDPEALHTGLLQVMRTKMVDYSSFVKVKQSLSIFINLWEKTFCRSYSEFLNEFSNQLVLSQLRTIRGSKTRELDEIPLRLLSACYIQMNCCRQIHVIAVTVLVINRIEQVFVNLKLVKGLKKMKMVEVIARIEPEGDRLVNGSPTP
jgi:hypothetical protein